MSLLELFYTTDSREKTKAIEGLITHSSPRAHFFLMIVLSVVMATLGILMESTIVLIASMLIAPMLYPILSFSMGLVVGDVRLITRSTQTLVKTFVIAVATSAMLSLLFRSTLFDPDAVALQYTNPEFLFLSMVIALVSGFAGAYALIKPELSESLPGIAIAVALVPPLAAVGVALSLLNFEMMRGAFLLFIINVFGIILAAVVVFSLFQMSSKKHVASEAVKTDDKEVAFEKAKAEEAQQK